MGSVEPSRQLTDHSLRARGQRKCRPYPPSPSRGVSLLPPARALTAARSDDSPGALRSCVRSVAVCAAPRGATAATSGLGTDPLSRGGGVP